MTQRLETLPVFPGGGRQIEHDEQSKNYPAEKGALLREVIWARYTPILNQMRLGSCTGNAGTGLLGTSPFYLSLPKAVQDALNEDFAIKLYEDATVVDGFPGQYPPDDTGSSGLAIGKVLRRRKMIKWYGHAFGIEHTLRALTKRPGITGIPWLNSMFDTDSNGRVKVDRTSGIAGGHEVLVRGYSLTNLDPNNLVGRVLCDNEWDTSWGDKGSFEIDVQDYAWLLSQQGDFMTATPIAA